MAYLLQATCPSCGFSDYADFGPSMAAIDVFLVPVLDTKKGRLITSNIFDDRPGKASERDFMVSSGERVFPSHLVPYFEKDLSENTVPENYIYGNESAKKDMKHNRISMVRNKCPGCGNYTMNFNIAGMVD